MAINVVGVYTPAEAEGLMERAFGQFQKRLAAGATRERLANARARLDDIRRMWDDSDVSLDDVVQYFKLEDRRRAIRIELRRLRPDPGAERRNPRGRPPPAQGRSGRLGETLEGAAQAPHERQEHLRE